MKRYKLGDPEQCHNQFNCIREGFQKNIKMVGFIKRSSDPSQPGRASDKKKSKITPFFYVFFIFILTKFCEDFEEKNDICFFLNVFGGKVKVKKSE